MLVTLDNYESAVSYLNEHDSIAFDTETMGIDWRGCPLVGICLQAGERGYYFPFRHLDDPDNLPENLIQDVWHRVLPPHRKQITHHCSYDYKIGAYHDGYKMPDDGNSEDTIIAALLMNENEESFKLETLGGRYVDKNAGDVEDQLINYIVDRYGGGKKDAKGKLWMCPAKIVEPYGCQDVWTTRRLRDFYVKHLDKWSMLDLWHSVCDYQKDICEIEMTGVLVDRELLHKLEFEADIQAAALLKEIQELAGYPINPNSPAQVSTWLGMKSTAKRFMQANPDYAAQLVLEYRGWAKAGSTYYRPYGAWLASDNVLRCNLHITTPGTKARGKHDSRNGTVAGRLSSSKPNLQQIPRESDTYGVKRIFRARDGKLLAELDYVQSQLRWAAHFSRDERLTRLLLAGTDMHDATAEGVGCHRQIAKNINFSVWFGIGPDKFAIQYGHPLDKSRHYLSKMHTLHPGIRRLQRACEAKAIQNGYIKNPIDGRMRHYNDPENAPTFAASNNLIQLAEAAAIRRAQMRIRREVPLHLLRQVLQVHDSIWCEVEDSPEGMAALEDASAIMQDVPECSLPMLVDKKIGKTLGTAKKLPRSLRGVPQAAAERLTYDPTA